MLFRKTHILIILMSLSTVVNAQVFINEVVSSNTSVYPDEDGDYSDWIEFYNNTGSIINLTGYGLSDDSAEHFKWVFPNVEIEANGFLIVFASDKNRISPENPLHTNFKISSSGENIILTKPNSVIEDSFNVAALPADVSYGRQPDGSGSFYFFNQPTPLSSNSTAGFLGIASDVAYSLPSGFYNSSVTIELSTNDSNEIIYFTVDGSVPTENSELYQNPISFDSTTVIRACAYAAGKIDGKVITNSYLLNEPSVLPVISLSTNPENLWSDSAGIYILGPNADTSDYPYWGANFWEDWERPAHIEFFDDQQILGFSIDAGIKIFGSWSRIYPQKSLSVFARGMYGVSEIDCKIFPDKDIDKYQSFIMRNSGQDWGRTFFRDALIHSFAEGADVDVQAYRPVLAYFNGKPMGIFNLREKMSEHYIESNHGVTSDALDMIERDTTLLHGDFVHYNNLIEFLETHQLQVQANYDSIKRMIDINSFIDYLIIRNFAATSDWPWNNVKIWRPKTETGKWRWLLYDTDYGFHGGHLGPATNMFTEIFNQDTHTSFMVSKLIENHEFVYTFANRYADRMNTVFAPDNLQIRINQFKDRISSAMQYHIDKWKYTFNEVWWLGKSIDSMDEWNANIQIARNFANMRADFERQNIANQFSQYINGIAALILYPPGDKGNIKVNSVLVENYPWSGKYFSGVPVKLEAVPNPGYKFVRWIGNNIPQSNPITIDLTDGQVISAEFAPAVVEASSIVINEINYNSSSSFDPDDWVELYNNSDSTIILGGYKFKDENDDHIFEIPSEIELQSGEYIVLCADSLKFTSSFPGVNNFVGQLGFGLSGGGELVRLFDSNGVLVDSLTYDDTEPWPSAADGSGSTLSLKNPALDNSLAESWEASLGFGTPGIINDIFTNNNEEKIIEVSFELSQNYPNPFNPSTNIEFSIPKSAMVKMDIFNILGEKVRGLINETLDRGHYNYTWNSKNDSGLNMPSGVYIYSIYTDGTLKESKKMILLR